MTRTESRPLTSVSHIAQLYHSWKNEALESGAAVFSVRGDSLSLGTERHSQAPALLDNSRPEIFDEAPVPKPASPARRAKTDTAKLRRVIRHPRRAARLLPEQLATIEDGLKQNLIYPQIAKNAGCATRTVQTIATRRGIRRKLESKARQLDYAKLAADVREGKTTFLALSREHKCDVEIIREKMKEHGVVRGLNWRKTSAATSSATRTETA